MNNAKEAKSSVGLGEPISVGRPGYAEGGPLKIVAGIDPHEPFDAVMGTIRALAPHGASVHLVHAFDPKPQHNAAERGEQAELTLSGARAALEASGLGAAWIQRTSDPAKALMDVAEAEHADLIAIGSPSPGGGRVARQLLAKSPVSLLIARTVPKQTQGLRAVLATDHSPFIKEGIRRLLRMNPAGLKEIVVLTANQVVGGAAAMMVQGLPGLAEDAERWIAEKITEENAKVCETLAPLGAVCRPEVREGYPNEMIEAAMRDSDSDLLIIGAPEHGLLERLAFGSVSGEEVLRAPYSVLALRP